VNEQPTPQPQAAGPLGRRSLRSRLGHLAFWTALFYGLVYGIAKLCEWLASL